MIEIEICDAARQPSDNNKKEYIDYRNAYWEYLSEEGYDEYSEDYM